jgi:tetratricopeptide (TPR) repeat protein
MPDNALQAYEYAERYAWKAKDTIKVFTFWGNKSDALINQGKIEEALRIKEAATEGFRKMGYPQYAAQVMGLCIKWYARQGEFEKAKAAMDEFENHSGYFLKNGDIEPGREDYYQIKGSYYYERGDMDSAQYFFRKLLQQGESYNDIYLASWGLTQLYHRYGKQDSVAKYALQTLVHSDTLYNIGTVENLQNAQAMYNYTRHLETAHRKELEAKDLEISHRNWIIGGTAIVFALILLALIFYRKDKKKAQTIEGLNCLIEEKKGLIHSLNRQLEQQAIDIEDYHQKVETIQVLNQKIATYETGMINRVNANLINQLNKEPAIQTIIHRLNSKDKNTENNPLTTNGMRSIPWQKSTSRHCATSRQIPRFLHWSIRSAYSPNCASKLRTLCCSPERTIALSPPSASACCPSCSIAPAAQRTLTPSFLVCKTALHIKLVGTSACSVRFFFARFVGFA